jgi:hypothetical protein
MFATVYVRTIKRRKTGRVETLGCVYRTKTLTDMHASIRSRYPGAQTFENPVSIITDFIAGWNLGCLPIVSGGTRIA